jgi:hypothetical protein
MKALEKRTVILAALMTACGAHPVAEVSEGLGTPGLNQQIYDTAGSPEPGIAVGLKYVYALSSGSYRVFKRAQDGSLITPPLRPNTTLDQIFNTLVLSVNAHIATSPGSVLPCPYNEAMAAVDDSNVTAQDTGCVGQPYDSDVIYDAKRDRFWIMTHLRNLIYPCTVNGVPGWKTKADMSTCTPDPDPNHPPAHRIMAVAVTKSGESGGDPTKGFYVYGLVDEPGDFPQMMVHGDYLLLDDRERLVDDSTRPHAVYAFSADALANNSHSTSGQLLMEPAWQYGPSDFAQSAVDWNRSPPALHSVTLDTPIFFVKQPYSTDGTTYMVGGMGQNLVFYGLPPLPSDGSKPQMIQPGLVNASDYVPDNFAGLGDSGNYVPGVWNNGQFFWAWPACNGYMLTGDSTKMGDTLVSCNGNKRFVRAVRIPLSTGTFNGSPAVTSSTVPNYGWLSTTIGLNDDQHEYALPVVGVNQNNDWLVEYSRYPVAPPQTPVDVRYQVMFNNQNAFNSSQEIKNVDTLAIRTDGAPMLPGHGGAVDTPSVVADPLSPTQLWMSYGLPASPLPSPSSLDYQGFFTGVDVGPCNNDNDATDHFRAGMVGCGGHVDWSDATNLCSIGYHLCSANDWLDYAELTNNVPAVAPSADYWTGDLLNRTGTPVDCWAIPASSGGTSCGINPMHICTATGTDNFGNTCPWTGCSYDFVRLGFGGSCQLATDYAGALCCAD